MKYQNYFDKNPESKIYLDRLIEEWKQHNKIIIAVDFDDTISPWKLKQSDFTYIHSLLLRAKNVGAYISVFTACNPDRYDEIKTYCKNKNIPLDTINKNPIQLPYGNTSKIYANLFLDDRAGLNEALAILENAIEVMSEGKEIQNFDV